MKKLLLAYIFFFLILASSFVYADLSFQCLNSITNNISSNGANGNSVSFPSTISGYSGYYIQQNPDVSDLSGNYLSGYYYDSSYGFFQLNWSTGSQNNVRIVSEISGKCSGGGNGYKFSGYAKSADIGGGADEGYIDFDYASTSQNPAYSNAYVYYCLSDKKLHGYAYSDNLGFQSFSGISFDIITQGKVKTVLLKKSDPFFLNNFSDILNDNYGTLSNSVQGDVITKETGKETIFYIMK